MIKELIRGVSLMEVRFPEMKEIIERLSALEKMVEEIERKIRPAQEWYDLKSACRLKGINYNTVISNPRYQPNRGKPDAVICGRKRWRRETILKWLQVTDDCTEETLAIRSTQRKTERSNCDNK